MRTPALRRALPFTAPRTLGWPNPPAAATAWAWLLPGHVRAVRGSGLAPIFAQQSIREMARTQRTPSRCSTTQPMASCRGWRESRR